MPAVLPRRRPGAHWTACAPSAAVPPTNLAALKASATAAQPQPQAVRAVLDEHQNVLGCCVVCCTTWPCDVVLAQLSTTRLAS